MDDRLQAAMDRGARDIRRMVGESIQAADALCAAGDAQGSASAWDFASDLCALMAKGRGMSIGGVQPAFGGGKP